MAQETIGQNITFEIYNADGTSFNGLVLHKSTFESVVMSLGDKITGDVYYPTNALVVTMQEYIVYKGVKYSLVNPPTIVREGMASDNSELKGMTKYSFTFYHPMYMLANFPFSDVAVSSDQRRYLSENKTFYWIGNLVDYVAKLNKNLEGTEWCVEIGTTVPSEERTKLSEVLSFDKQTIADALKTGYETWEVPYVIDTIASTDSRYLQGKRFLVHFGLPSEEILVENEQHELVPFVFHFGQGVGLKNNSRTPRNNKIVTRIAGYGSETNVPYGYPQIRWIGDQSWDFTINNDSDDPHSYPIYDGIMNGEPVRLIKHPFTRSTLMPSIYYDTVNKKVNPYATGYNPSIEIKDYYDADNTYENPINPLEPSYEIHEFEKIKPELGQKSITGVAAYSDKDLEAISLASFLNILDGFHTESEFTKEKEEIDKISSTIGTMQSNSGSVNTRSYYCNWSFTKDERYAYVKFDSNSINFEYTVLMVSPSQSVEWDDSMDGDGNYKQSYFKITLPQLDFDLYACAAITQDMKINMRSGACLGCSFPVAVDWEDYKANFYDEDGNFAPQGSQRDFEKYPNSLRGSITLVVQKDIDTFGTLMPNRYQKPAANDEFVILGISLPYTYVVAAEERLDDDMKQYMRDNNVYYFDYPLKFDEHFLATHTGILEQMKPNIVVRFDYAGTTHALYIKQMSVKFWQSPLPQYDITLTDDVEIILNQIGRVTDEVSHLRVLLGQGGGSVDLSALDQRYLSRISDDKAKGLITFIRGLQIGENFVSGLLGEGGIFRRDADGTTYLETDKLYVRMRAYFDTVEVRRFIHSGGNRIASKAGIKCTRVEYIDRNGNVTNDVDDAVKFRCYFRANDNGVTITNDFEVNDLAFCKETNVDTDSINQHGYWRKVVGVGNTVSDEGELYIDLSASDCQSGSDIPIAQDDIIQLGNTTDTTRQGAIVEYVGGEDAPAYQIYQGINSYSLNNKNYVRFGYDSESGGAQAFIGNPDGSTYLWYHNVTEGGQTLPRLDIKANVRFTSPTTHQDTTIEDFASAVTGSIEDLQSQIDGEVDTWFYAGTPTLNNAPANEWATNAEKERHLGDLYYDIGTGDTGGFAYRFIKTESGGTATYSWQYIDDTAITEALAKASQAYDLADHKRRVFILPVTIGGVTYNNPYPPYDNGDMWVNAVWPASGAGKGSTYNDDILRCKTSKNSTQQFSINDWVKASKYTDDSALNDFVTNTYADDLAGIQTQVDGKAETFYQDTDPSTNWSSEDKPSHVGDIWYDTNANRGKKTYIWRDRGEGQSNRFYWAEQAVPSVVFDEIDGKAAIYVTWGAWIKEGVNNLNEKDLFIPADDTTQDSVTYKKDKVYRCTDASIPEFEEIQYTDDSGLQNFIDNTYNVKIVDLEKQIDGKAETWYQNTNPASASGWVAADHVGDLWYCTADIAGTDYKKGTTWFYKKTGTNTYAWVKQDVPEEVFDKIDGKSAIFTNTTSNPPTGYKKNDLWILPADATINSVSYKQGEVLTATNDYASAYKASDWTKKVRYTDDTAFNTFVNDTYSPFVTDIQNQIDGKAETWYQTDNPANAWNTPELKQAHKGDIWHNTSSSTVAGVDAGQDAIWSGTAWIMSDVPQEVYDLVDGKSAIWVTWNGWIDNQGNNNLMLNDLYIPSVDYPTSNPTYKQNKVYRCTTAGNSPVFTEINYTDNAEFNNFVDTTYSADKENLQNQIDGKYETWFYAGVPTTDNEPANTWDSTQKKEHVGDLYWDKTNKHAYRFVVNGSKYSWQQIGDEGVIAAMAQAADAQDTADNKRRVFTSTPTTPYDVGDLWAQGSGGDIFKCKTAKSKGQSFSQSDWELASKYTDDSSLLTFLDGYNGSLGEAIKEQVDKKAETWVSSSNPATAWNTTELKDQHVGDMWLNTSNAAVAGVGSMKTAIYTKSGSSYSWVVDNTIPNSVFDTIDGKKAIYVTWSSIVTAMSTNKLQVRDLFIPSSNTTQNGKTYTKNKVYRCTAVGAYSDGAITTYPTFVEIAYTDDSSLNSFLNTVYGTTVLEQIKAQNDKKAETWYQDSDPSTAWTTADLKSEHVGDIWHNTKTSTVSGVNAGCDAIYTKNGSTFSWEMSDVPQSVYDTIDGKADIFVTRPTTYNKYDMWIIEDGLASTYMPTGCKSGDIVVASGMTGTTTKRTNNYVKADWKKKDRYTDDGKVNEIINKYGNILGITSPTAENVGEAVAYLDGILKHPAGTDINGGLVLTSLIAMRGTESTPKVWGGMNGAYQSNETGTGYKGHGIAAWYGGAMVDHEVSTSATDYAKSLFRFDGSGYVASGNLSWDKNGNVTIQGYSINATTLQMGGSNVVTESVLANYVTIATAQTITGAKTFGTADGSYIQIGAVRIVYDATNNALKIVGSNGSSAANLYATGSVSALGAGSGGSSGGGDVTWALLASSSDTRQIALSHLTGALNSYATQSWVQQQISGYTPSSSTRNIIVNGVGYTVNSPYNTDIDLDSTYLKLSATEQRITSSINRMDIGVIQLYRTGASGSWCYLGFANNDSDGNLQGLGQIGFETQNVLKFRNIITGSSYKIWHEGNDGSGSGLDADLLDGQHGSYYATASSLGNYLPLTGGTMTSTIYFNNMQSRRDAGINCSLGTRNIILGIGTSGNAGMWVDGKGWIMGIDTSDNVFVNGNATSATSATTASKLSTVSKTAWGQTYWTSGGVPTSISGSISSTGTITPSSTITSDIGSTSLMYNHVYTRYIDTSDAYYLRLCANGTEFIDLNCDNTITQILTATSIAGLLTASGGITIPSGKTLKIGDAELSWDATNQGIKVTKGLYSQTFISALGVGSSGSSGTGDVTWALLASSSDTRQIALSHLTGALSSYATQSWVLSQIAGSSTGGTVTAVKVGDTTYNPSSGVVSLPAYLPLTGGTLTGGILIKYDTDSSRVCGFSMKDTSNSVTASILYHNTGQNWIINSNGSSDIWSDAEGKYSLIVGNDKLTYNTHTIWHTGNDDGLFTAFVADGTSTKITIGGTTKSLTIPYATEANRLLAGQILSANTFGDANTMQLDGEGTEYSVLTNYRSNSKWQNMPTFGTSAYGGVVEIKGKDSSLKMQFAWSAFHNNTTAPTDGLWYRARADKGYLASDWRKVAFTDSDITGNAATATKLKNTRKLWGNNFSGTEDVGGNIILDAGDGGRQVKIIKNGSFQVNASTGGMAGGLSAMTNDGSTTLGSFGYYCSGDTLIRLYIGTSYSSPWVSFLSDGSVGIGTTSPTEKLHVSGNAKATKFIGALEGNADTATTLKTARTLWGQSFDGSANISGDMSSVGNISFSATGKNIGGLIYFDTTNSRVGIKTSSPAYVLDAYGASRSKYMVFYNNAYDGNAGYVGAGSSSSNEIILEAYSGNALSLWANGTRTIYINTSNNVGIGTDSPSQKLHVSGNIYATGGVTCLSDIREKMIVRPTEITVEQVAKMPSIVYKWKNNGDDCDEHVGSIAQDWQKTLPQVVLTAKDEKKTLSMQYGVAALVSAITIARKVVDHERRIKELEDENKKLKEQLKIA